MEYLTNITRFRLNLEFGEGCEFHFYRFDVKEHASERCNRYFLAELGYLLIIARKFVVV